jgi:hypothetical protein
MRQTDAEVAQNFVGAYQYIGNHPEHFADIIRGKTYRQLGEVIGRLATFASGQAGVGLRAQTRTHFKREARDELLAHLGAIVSIAHVGTLTAFELTLLKMPTKGMSYHKIDEMAGVILGQAARHEQDFIDAGLPADFLERARAAHTRMCGENISRQGDQATIHGYTAGIEADMKIARKLLKSINNLLMITHRGDKLLVAEWRAVKRISPKASKAQLPAPATRNLLPATISAEQDDAKEDASSTTLVQKGLRRLMPSRTR